MTAPLAPTPAPSTTWAQRLFAALTARPRWVLAVATVLAGLGVFAGLQLPFLTARSAMLPRDLPESHRFEAFLKDFGAAADLVVVLEGPDPAALDAFAAELVARLESTPGVRGALRGIEPTFFAQVGWTLAPPSALEALAGTLEGALGAPSEADLAEPPPSTLTDAFERGAAWATAWDARATWPTDLAGRLAARTAARWLVDEVRRWFTAPAPPAGLDLVSLARPFGAERAVDPAFRSRDGRLAFVFVRPADASEEFAVVGPFVEGVRQAGRALQRTWRAEGSAPPTVGLTGLPAVVAEEFLAVQADLALVVGSAAALIALLVLVGLRSWRRALVVFVPMGLGVAWNLGLTGPLIGHLTILTSSFTAILFGLGVDYGIFLSAAVLQAPAEGADWRTRVVRGAAGALRPLAVAGGATALVFAALAPSDFPGFAELGLMAASGVVVVWLATVVVQPALLCVLSLEAEAPSVAAQAAPAAAARPAAPPQAERPHRAPRLTTLVAVAVAAVGLGLSGRIGFDYDVLGLLPAGSEAAALQRRMVAESDFQAEALVLTAPDLPTARALADRAQALPVLASVQRIDPFFPADAAARAAQARRVGVALSATPGGVAARAGLAAFEIEVDAGTLAAFDRLLAALGAALANGAEAARAAGDVGVAEDLAELGAELAALRNLVVGPRAGPQAAARLAVLADTGLRLARAGLAALSGWASAAPLTPADLPAGLRDRFFSRTGAVAVYGFPARSVYDPAALDALLDQVYAVAPEATGFPTTHRAFSAVVVRAFAEGSGLAAALALLWMALTLRRPAAVAVAALPLLVGGGALLLLQWAGGLRFNFANIVALPLVMGLALDYGVWFAHQRLDHPTWSAVAVARLTRRPILLAAATTLAGLGAITLARYQGVASMGLALTLGLVTCVVAALWVAPRAAAWWMPARPSAGTGGGSTGPGAARDGSPALKVPGHGELDRLSGGPGGGPAGR